MNKHTASFAQFFKALGLSTLLCACGQSAEANLVVPEPATDQIASVPQSEAKVEPQGPWNKIPSSNNDADAKADKVERQKVRAKVRSKSLGAIIGSADKKSAASDIFKGEASASLSNRGGGGLREKRAVTKKSSKRKRRSVVKPMRKPHQPMVVDAEEQRPPQERFVDAGVNPMTLTEKDNKSTFAVDVDTGSYTIARGMMEAGGAPYPGAVRVEEWLNYFNYDYDAPKSGAFDVHIGAAPSPLHSGQHIVRIGVRGKDVARKARKPIHATFLVDVSGSMRRNLPLVKKSMRHLLGELDARDSVAIVTYAGRTGVELAATKVTGQNRAHIESAIAQLRSGGGTHMSDGMTLAYREAGKHLSSKNISRVIVFSDGDANIGKSSHQEMLKSIKGYVSEGVTMSTVGFGRGNYQDHLMEQLANAGNGNYNYIDSDAAAKRVFVEKMVGTMQVIAKDVKIQVEFDKQNVESYRLIGYENRDVADKDFRNDKVDAGEIGAGHNVTALYEIKLRNDTVEGNVATVRVRHKTPRGTKATESSFDLSGEDISERFDVFEDDARFAMAVSTAAELFRHSPHVENVTIDDVILWATASARGRFKKERMDFVRLLQMSKPALAKR